MTRNCLWIHLETCVQIDVLYEYVHSQWCYWFKLCNQGLLHWVLECFTFAAMSWTEGYPGESRLSFIANHASGCESRVLVLLCTLHHIFSLSYTVVLLDEEIANLRPMSTGGSRRSIAASRERLLPVCGSFLLFATSKASWWPECWSDVVFGNGRVERLQSMSVFFLLQDK